MDRLIVVFEENTESAIKTIISHIIMDKISPKKIEEIVSKKGELSIKIDLGD